MFFRKIISVKAVVPEGYKKIKKIIHKSITFIIDTNVATFH